MQLYKIRVMNMHWPAVLLVQANAGTKLFPPNCGCLNLLYREALLSVPFDYVQNATLVVWFFPSIQILDFGGNGSVNY